MTPGAGEADARASRYTTALRQFLHQHYALAPASSSSIRYPALASPLCSYGFFPAGGLPVSAGVVGIGTADLGCCAARDESESARIFFAPSTARSNPAELTLASYFCRKAFASGEGMSTYDS